MSMFFKILLSIILWIIIIALISIPLGMLGSRKWKRKVGKTFEGREALNNEEFYERFFRQQGIPFFVSTKVRKILEEVLGADLSRLKDGDDFSTNLSFFFEYDSLANVSIVESLEEEFLIKISDDEAASTKTVRDIVNLVWAKLEDKENISTYR